VDEAISATLLGLLDLLVVPEVSQAGTFAPGFSTTSSTKVFQELQEGHLPSHLADSYPQL
jgi:hypothetical protein